MQSREEHNRVPAAIVPWFVTRGGSGSGATYIFNDAVGLLGDRTEIDRRSTGDTLGKDPFGM
jgi:hypothetical protein